jgi:hypothetical protein
MTTAEAIKHGAGTLADTATSALSDLADKAKAQTENLVSEVRDQRKESHRGRTLLIGATLIGLAAAAFRVLRTRMGGQGEHVIDLTQDPVLVPETLPTP